MTGFVYFVTDGERIKIGFSIDPAGRVRALQTAQGVPLRLIGAVPGNHQLERDLHRRFAGARLVGEWFWSTPKLEEDIRRIIAAPPPIPDAPTPNGDRELCERLFGFLRAQHPTRTAEHVSALTGISRTTIFKWMERNSFPSGPAVLQLLDLYGAALLVAVMSPVPSWVLEVESLRRREEVVGEIGRLLNELRDLDTHHPPSTGPPERSDVAAGDEAPAHQGGP